MTGGKGVAAREAIRVYLVDDHSVVRDGVRALLDADGGFDIVGEAGAARPAVTGVAEAEADVAIVDVRLGQGSGVEVIREIHAQSPGTRCLVLTAFDEEQAFFQTVMAGASGFVLKDATREVLVDAIRRVAAGESMIRPELLEDLRARGQQVPDNLDLDLRAGLTGQERRTVALIATGMTNREIATEMCLAEKTVRNYVSNVLMKLSLSNRTQVAMYVARKLTTGHAVIDVE